MSKRSTHHDTFVIERTYPASPEKVYRAWSDPESKARWLVGPNKWQDSNHKLDFRVGGHESVSGGPPGGPVYHFNATFQDIVPNERIVSTYDMHMGDKRISVSLTTVELRPAGAGTTLTYTEQGVFLDGYDTVAAREHGTKDLLDNLGKFLHDGRA